MFEFLKSEQKKKEPPTSEEYGFEVTSADAMYDVVESNGALISEPEELAQAPKTKDGVVELGKFPNDKDLNPDFLPNTIEVSQREVKQHSAFFTDEEIEELSKAEHRFEKEELEAADRVKEALDDPELPNTRSELWQHLARQEGKFGLESKKELSQAEKDAQMTESLRQQGIDAQHEHPDNKQVSEMTGAEFKQVMGQAIGGSIKTEEMQQSEELEEEPAVEIEEIDQNKAQAAAAAFERHGGVWEEMAEDITTDIPETNVFSQGDGSRIIKTKYNPLIEELEQLHNNSRKESRILNKEEGIVEARVWDTEVQP